MLELGEVLGASKRNFIIVAHRARSDHLIQLNDLCGASGRWDGIARSMNAALHLSHDMRRDTSVHILLLGPDDPPKLLTLNGEKVRYLNPDERASSALMRKCLKDHLGVEAGSMAAPSPGVTLARVDLEGLLSALPGPLVELREDGDEPGSVIEGVIGSEQIFFLLSDDLDLTGEESETVSKRLARRMSLGHLSLHSNMAITIVHYLIDKKEAGARSHL